MNAFLRRAASRLLLTLGALAALTVIGQPIDAPTPESALPSAISRLERLPVAATELFQAQAAEVADDCPLQQNAAVAAENARAAAAAAVIRSAVRMRWLLTAPHATSRTGCIEPDCTG